MSTDIGNAMELTGGERYVYFHIDDCVAAFDAAHVNEISDILVEWLNSPGTCKEGHGIEHKLETCWKCHPEAMGQ